MAREREPEARRPRGRQVRVPPCQHADCLGLTAHAAGNPSLELHLRAREGATVEDQTKAHEQGPDSDVMGGRSARPGRRDKQGDVMGGRTAEARQRGATESAAPPSFRPSLRQRVETWWKRDRLDEQLAQGADPNATAELRLRAAQLVSAPGRVELANALETAVREARGRQGAVHACGDDLLALAQRLRDERPISVRGAAMTRRLTDLVRARPVGRVPFRATSALDRADAEPSLQEAVRSAQLAVEPSAPDKRSFPSAA